MLPLGPPPREVTSGWLQGHTALPFLIVYLPLGSQCPTQSFLNPPLCYPQLLICTVPHFSGTPTVSALLGAHCTLHPLLRLGIRPREVKLLFHGFSHRSRLQPGSQETLEPSPRTAAPGK